jgi:cell division septum initiation protein DivIVA
MERLAPIDIDHSNLKIGLKGYDRPQVDVLLNRVKNEMAGMLDELKAAREEVERQRQLINSLTAQENTVKDTLLIASRAGEEIKTNAQKEADATVAKAHRTAEETQRQYQAKINDLRWELERMRMERQKFAADFRNMLETHLRGLTEETVPTNGVVEPNENIRAAIDAPV